MARLPGSVNNKATPVPVEVLQADWSRTYTVRDWEIVRSLGYRRHQGAPPSPSTKPPPSPGVRPSHRSVVITEVGLAGEGRVQRWAQCP